MKRIVIALISVAVISGAAFAQNTGTAKPAVPAVAKTPAKAMCPIMKHDFAVNAKTLTSSYKGKTYYFCCGGCKPAFDKEPAKYAMAFKPAPKETAPPVRRRAKPRR